MFSAKLTVINPADYLATTIREANEVGVVAAIRHWHKYFLPDHFTLEANKRYGYQKRQGDDEPPVIPAKRRPGSKGAVRMIKNPHYSWRKRRQMRHNLPLVWSGDTMRQAKRSIKIKTSFIKSSGKIRGVGTMDVPRYIYQYRKDLSQPDKYAEMIRTTAQENEALLEVHNKAAENYLKTAPMRKTVKRVA